MYAVVLGNWQVHSQEPLWRSNHTTDLAHSTISRPVHSGHHPGSFQISPQTIHSNFFKYKTQALWTKLQSNTRHARTYTHTQTHTESAGHNTVQWAFSGSLEVLTSSYQTQRGAGTCSMHTGIPTEQARQLHRTHKQSKDKTPDSIRSYANA